MDQLIDLPTSKAEARPVMLTVASLELGADPDDIVAANSWSHLEATLATPLQPHQHRVARGRHDLANASVLVARIVVGKQSFLLARVRHRKCPPQRSGDQLRQQAR